MQPNTKVVFTESPGSHTFEVQDIPALAEVAHAHGAKVLMDNTWGIHHFQPFRHGVDVSIQALTKYVAGHSDVLLGSVTTNAPEDWEKVRMTAIALGQYASPDDCWLALRGVRTMGVRLKQQEASGITMAEWFAARPEVLQVLHPALPGAPGHELWKRDFTGACSLFGVVFRPEYTVAGGTCHDRRPGAVWHRSKLGRLREPGAAHDRHPDPHRRQRRVRGNGGQVPYRA